MANINDSTATFLAYKRKKWNEENPNDKIGQGAGGAWEEDFEEAEVLPQAKKKKKGSQRTGTWGDAPAEISPQDAANADSSEIRNLLDGDASPQEQMQSTVDGSVQVAEAALSIKQGVVQSLGDPSNPHLGNEEESKIINTSPLQKKSVHDEVKQQAVENTRPAARITGQEKSGPSSQFKEALNFFLPNIIGLVGGAVFGGAEAAVLGERKAGQLAGSMRAYGMDQAKLKVKQDELKHKKLKGGASAIQIEKLKVSKMNAANQMKRTSITEQKEFQRQSERHTDKTTELKKTFYAKNKDNIVLIRDLKDSEALIGADQLSANQIGRFNARIIFKEIRPTDEDVVGAKYPKGFWEDVAAKPHEYFTGKADTPEKVAVRKMYKIIVTRKRATLKESISSHISPSSLRATGKTEDQLYDELEKTAEIFTGDDPRLSAIRKEKARRARGRK